MMNDARKSDSSVVPGKSLNKAGQSAAEAVEGRGLAKGNLPESNTHRTQCRGRVQSALERIRQAARKDRKQQFTSLLHHVYSVEHLRAAYLAIKRDAAAGVDGETWQHYGENLEVNLQDLSTRLARGAYRAKPVRRMYIPKADGRLRPLGVPTSLRWRTSSSSERLLRYATPSTKRTSSDSPMDSGRGVARTERWMRSRLASRRRR
jgi:hypothetical protein